MRLFIIHIAVKQNHVDDKLNLKFSMKSIALQQQCERLLTWSVSRYKMLWKVNLKKNLKKEK